jgi:hypothetical protein
MMYGINMLSGTLKTPHDAPFSGGECPNSINSIKIPQERILHGSISKTWELKSDETQLSIDSVV